jgi:GNAT superfamily N-acetyltransferase
LTLAVRPLAEADLDAADQVFRLAFGTQFGLPDPMTFRGDSELVRTRWRAEPAGAFGAFNGHELVGSSFAARWGSLGVFGPLSVRPDCWEQGIGKRLMEPTMALFDGWRTRQVALFTFAQSPKHVGLYQKFGFWPQSLTAVMSKPVQPTPQRGGWSPGQDSCIPECASLSDAVFPGLDLEREIRAIRAQRLGETLLLREGSRLRGFAVCHAGKGSEAGSGSTYIKFAAVQPGDEPGFARLLGACEAFAAENHASKLIAGVNTARHRAYRKMLDRGFRTFLHGVAMQRPNDSGYNSPEQFVIDDWR